MATISFLRLAGILFASLFVLIGISLQLISAGNLYGVPLSDMCKAYSGSPDYSDKESFDKLIDAVLVTRKQCLGGLSTNITMAERAERVECCEKHSPGPSIWQLSGICAKPWLLEISQKNNSDITDLTPMEKMELFTSVLGDFIGVQSADGYMDANPEFWCKNCPDDQRKNCPFDPAPGSAREKVCDCPSGRVSTASEPFWSMVTDHGLTADFVRCDDKAVVYQEWVKALFPDFTEKDIASMRYIFENKCLASKSPLGYILSVGPMLALLATMFSIVSLPAYCANSPMSAISFNTAMLAIALSIIGVWPLEFSGASDLLARYAVCEGRGAPAVLYESGQTAEGFTAGPTLYNHIPCEVLPRPYVYMYCTRVPRVL
ncbi:hypothetical protein T484DRAFT_3172556 [Baffinella frigidus]|nr:hypothetical protein T484DRAFT_3172556 [Cryptophyta sp. CCMP2293]